MHELYTAMAVGSALAAVSFSLRELILMWNDTKKKNYYESKAFEQQKKAKGIGDNISDTTQKTSPKRPSNGLVDSDWVSMKHGLGMYYQGGISYSQQQYSNLLHTMQQPKSMTHEEYLKEMEKYLQYLELKYGVIFSHTKNESITPEDTNLRILNR